MVSTLTGSYGFEKATQLMDTVLILAKDMSNNLPECNEKMFIRENEDLVSLILKKWKLIDRLYKYCSSVENMEKMEKIMQNMENVENMENDAVETESLESDIQDMIVVEMK
jgi:hypothetical protein